MKMTQAYFPRMDGRPLDNGVHWLDRRKNAIKDKRLENLKKARDAKKSKNISDTTPFGNCLVSSNRGE